MIPSRDAFETKFCMNCIFCHTHIYATCFLHTFLDTCIKQYIIIVLPGIRVSRGFCFSEYCIGASFCVRYIVTGVPSAQLRYVMVYYVLIY
jgi:hypothetical protein